MTLETEYTEQQQRVIETWLVNESNELEKLIKTRKWDSNTLHLVIITVLSHLTIPEMDVLIRSIQYIRELKRARQLAAKPIGQRSQE